jgi:hypothetical protein
MILVVATGALVALLGSWGGPGVNVFGIGSGYEQMAQLFGFLVAIVVVCIAASFLMRSSGRWLAALLIVVGFYLGLVAGSAAMYQVSLTHVPSNNEQTGGFMNDTGGFNTLREGYQDVVIGAATFGVLSLNGPVESPDLWLIVAAAAGAGIGGAIFASSKAGRPVAAPHRTSAST